MHVLYFHQYFQTLKGTSGTRSYKMAKALIRAGHTVTMVCGSSAGGNTGINKPFTNGRRREVIEDIDVIEFDLKYSNHLSYIKRIMVFIKFIIFSIGILLREPADIIFATSTPLTVSIPGIFARWFKNKYFILEVRDLWPELPIAMGIIKNPIIIWILSFLEWVSYHSANRLIALSPGIFKGIVARGISLNKIDIIPNGSDFNLFHDNILPTRPDGVGQNDLMAIFSGSHGEANGLKSILSAASIIKKRGRKDIKIILIGEGKLKLKLIERAKFEKLDNIIFLDPIPKIQLASLILSANVGLQILSNVPAFYYGTSPNKFFDYIAAGLPVLNNYPGWIADLIVKNKCGYIVKPDNPESFADALVHAAENPNSLKLMGINARNLAKKEFDMKILEEKFINCFKNVIK
jgi:glycosyltransferase involved in cell wall biosynthesis